MASVSPDHEDGEAGITLTGNVMIWVDFVPKKGTIRI